MQREGRDGRNAPRGGEGRSADLSAAARERALRRRKHRRHVLAVFYLVLFLAVLGTAAALSLTVFFKIDGISVAGTSRYSEQQIIEASGIKKGDNLLLVKTREDAQSVRRKLPYVGSAKITRQFPAEVQIDVSTAAVLGAASCGSGFIILGSDGTVLENVSSPPKGCPLLRGLKFKKAQPGLTAMFTDPNQESVFNAVADAVSKSGIGKITSADFSQSAKILLVYDGRVTIDLGLPADLDYKLDFAKSLLQSKIKSTEKGTLNLSTVSETDRAYFDPDYGAASSSAAKK